MTEGGATRMKRNGTRSFKNPPQPHMCIQDVIKGYSAPCYINVLSWEKIAKPCKPSQPVPLYGGMRVRPPRTKADAIVFAVMANPEVLQINGKNAQDPKKRSILIEMLLDFVEAMNAGVVFTRRYKILKDRDITGELKEVWNAVQARRDREQPPPQQETWIDAQPPVPQYPQYVAPDQQQQMQQTQQEYTGQQPPQYHTSVAYGRAITGEGIHYEGYGQQHQPQAAVMPQNDQMFQQQMVPQQFHGGNLPRIPQDRYSYRDRAIEMRLEDLSPKLPQQSCPAYPTPRYQFSQLPRHVVIPQYVNSNVHPNPGLGYGPAGNGNPVNPVINANLASSAFQPYITYRQRMDNAMHVDMRRMQTPQQQQIHMNPVPQYEPGSVPFGVQTTSNAMRLGRPHMGVAQKNNASKRPNVNSPTHSKQSQACVSCQGKEGQDNGAKPKSPVKVLQRELPTASTVERQENHGSDRGKSPEKNVEEAKEELETVNETKKKNGAEVEPEAVTGPLALAGAGTGVLSSAGAGTGTLSSAAAGTGVLSSAGAGTGILSTAGAISGILSSAGAETETLSSAGAASGVGVLSSAGAGTGTGTLSSAGTGNGTGCTARARTGTCTSSATETVASALTETCTSSRPEAGTTAATTPAVTFGTGNGTVEADKPSESRPSDNRVGHDSNSPEDRTEDKSNAHHESKPDYANGDSKKPSKVIVMKGNKHKEDLARTTNRNRFTDNSQRNESPKRSQTTVNSIIKSVFKIHPGASQDETGRRRSNGQSRTNGRTNGESNMEDGSQQQGYTILKKTDPTVRQEETVSLEMSQLAIQDCKETPEVGPAVLL